MLPGNTAFLRYGHVIPLSPNGYVLFVSGLISVSYQLHGLSFGRHMPSRWLAHYVFTDGYAEQSVERRFAEDMDLAEEVSVYAKLPLGFQIPTPVGNYSPDWAIAFHQGMVKHIYFIAETKGSMESMQLRAIENAKIACAKKLFNTLSNAKVRYGVVDSYQHLMSIMGK